MRKLSLLGSLGLVAILSMAVSVPTSAPPLEELALGAVPPVDELALAGFPVVSVEDLVLAAQPKTNPIPHVSPERFFNLYVEPKCTCSVDFGVLWSFGLGVQCRESSACTCPGATAGDACIAATSYGVDDGGTVVPEDLQLTCGVTATNAIKFKVCYRQTDAGTLDLGAGLFTGRIVH